MTVGYTFMANRQCKQWFFFFKLLLKILQHIQLLCFYHSWLLWFFGCYQCFFFNQRWLLSFLWNDTATQHSWLLWIIHGWLPCFTLIKKILHLIVVIFQMLCSLSAKLIVLTFLWLWASAWTHALWSLYDYKVDVTRAVFIPQSLKSIW